MLSVLVLAAGGRAGSQPLAGEQDSLRAYFEFGDPAPLSCLAALFPTELIQHGIELKSFIRSKTFAEIRRRFGDLKAVDAVFVRAMRLTDNNTGVALLLATIATFDHRVVGLKIPLLSLSLPLSDESGEDFGRRVGNLPSRLYSDGPETPSGDRDKLQHFFGSAFLTFVFESTDAAMRFGEFVERGEDAFIIGGVDDDRDRRADLQGQHFGSALLEDNLRMPAGFLKLGIAGRGVR